MSGEEEDKSTVRCKVSACGRAIPVERRAPLVGEDMTMVMMTAFAARERERGTMENLLAMPVGRSR
jgi:hypothetical protein